MLNVVIDELTNSVIEVATGKSFSTSVKPTTIEELQTLEIDWQFDWIAEFDRGEVFKLIVSKLGRQIHGLISLSPREDHIWINVVENHPENIGRRKKYAGVAANLIAYACKLAFEKGHDGFVSFDAKTELIAHYQQTLNATQVGRTQRMYLDRAAAQQLVDKYFGGHHAKE